MNTTTSSDKRRSFKWLDSETVPFQVPLCRIVPKHVSPSSGYSGQAASYRSHYQGDWAICHSIEMAGTEIRYTTFNEQQFKFQPLPLHTKPTVRGVLRNPSFIHSLLYIRINKSFVPNWAARRLRNIITVPAITNHYTGSNSTTSTMKHKITTVSSYNAFLNRKNQEWPVIVTPL